MFKNIFTIISILFLTVATFAANKTVMVDKASNELKVPSKQTFWERNISVFRQNKRIYVDMTPSISLAYSQYSQNIESNTNLKHNFWTDTEIKVINKNGDLLYFTTTINLGSDSIAYLHGPDVLYDKNPKISYWFCTNSGAYGSKGCWGIKKDFDPTPENNATNSIGAYMASELNNTGSGVTAIWIIPFYDDPTTEPDSNSNAYSTTKNFKITAAYKYYLDKGMVASDRGELIKFIFDDPDNTVLCWRQNLMYGENNPYGWPNSNTDTLAYSKLWRPCVLEPYGPILQQAPIDINKFGREEEK